jgi:hypothetical protein
MKHSVKKLLLFSIVAFIPVCTVLWGEAVYRGGQRWMSRHTAEEAEHILHALRSADSFDLVGQIYVMDGGTTIGYFEVVPSNKKMAVSVPPSHDFDPTYDTLTVSLEDHGILSIASDTSAQDELAALLKAKAKVWQGERPNSAAHLSEPSVYALNALIYSITHYGRGPPRQRKIGY